MLTTSRMRWPVAKGLSALLAGAAAAFALAPASAPAQGSGNGRKGWRS